MSRRCRPLIAAAVTVAAVALAPVVGRTQALSPTLPPNTTPSSGVLGPPDAMAQAIIPDPNAGLLAPDASAAQQQRLRRRAQNQDQTPPRETFTAPSRIGATPQYGSPQGFGASTTGFDSMNLPKSKKKRLQAQVPPAPGVPVPETTFDPLATTQFAVPAPPPVATAAKTPAPPSQVYPTKAAARPGAVPPPLYTPLPIDNVPPEVHPQSASTRPGATLPVPPPIELEQPAGTASASTPPLGTQPMNTLPLGTPVPRPIPVPDTDPYSPVGIRGGSFMFFPAVELDAAYDTNPQHIPGGGPSAYFVVAPELQVQSLWSRHSLTATIVGDYYDYTNNGLQPSLNRPYLNSKIDGRIDVTRDTQVLLENRVIVSTDNPGSPNLPAGLAKLPIDTTVGGTAGVVQNFNPVILTLKGSIDRTEYQDSVLTDGETASNADRNLNQYAAIGRVGFDLNTGVIPFVEVQGDQRIYDETIDASGNMRNSTGIAAKAGATVNIVNTLTGEMAAGYLQRNYVDPTLSNIAGFTLDGALTWQATALTSAKFLASSVVNESVLTGVSGSLSRDVGIQVDHAFRRYLIATFKVGYGQDDYVGGNRVDSRYYVSGGITYKFNRDVWLRGEVRHDWLASTAPDVAYNATSFLLGLRLQR